MARIVLITPYFWPEIAANVPLMKDLCEDLAIYGHSVVVITSFPSKKIYSKEKIKSFEFTQDKNIKNRIIVLRHFNPFSRKLGFIMKVLEYITFCFWSIYDSLKYIWNADIIFVYSNPPLIALPLSFFKLIKKISIIYNIQDLFPNSAVGVGMIKKDFLIKILRYLEKITYEKIDVAAVICEHFAEHVKKISQKTRIEIISNWVDIDNIKYVPPIYNELFNELNLTGKFVVSYAGNIGYAQNIDIVVDAAYQLRDFKNIKFVIIGEGQYENNIKRRIKMAGIDNLIMTHMRPIEMVSKVYSIADVSLVTTRKGLGYSAVPSKTWTIMACGRPIIACIDEESELSKILIRNNLGLVVPPDNPNKLADAILMLYKNESLRKKLSNNERLYVERHLSRKMLTKKYDFLIKEMVKKMK
jgi:glycosyltransferase involved in cell wall biosynthesis